MILLSRQCGFLNISQLHGPARSPSPHICALIWRYVARPREVWRIVWIGTYDPKFQTNILNPSRGQNKFLLFLRWRRDILPKIRQVCTTFHGAIYQKTALHMQIVFVPATGPAVRLCRRKATEFRHTPRTRASAHPRTRTPSHPVPTTGHPSSGMRGETHEIQMQQRAARPTIH
jgi:hypothetical protein